MWDMNEARLPFLLQPGPLQAKHKHWRGAGRVEGRGEGCGLGNAKGVTRGWQGDDEAHQAVCAPVPSTHAPTPRQHRGN